MRKICKKCGIEKDLSLFRFRITTAGNKSYNGKCNKCIYDDRAKNNKLNQKPISENDKKYQKKWRKENKEQINKKERERFNANENIRLKSQIKTFNRNVIGYKFINLPFNIEELKSHLEKQFNENINWNNYGKYWNIAHLKLKKELPHSNISDVNFNLFWNLNNITIKLLEKVKKIKKVKIIKSEEEKLAIKKLKRKQYKNNYISNPENRKKMNERDNKTFHSNPIRKLKKFIQFSLKKSKTNPFNFKFQNIEFSIQELKEHLEKQFTNEMNWENYGKYWSIDHILCSPFFNHTKSIENYKKYWELNNLQPRNKTEIKKKQRVKKRFNEDPKYKLRMNISQAIRNMLIFNKSSKMGKSILNYLEYTMKELQNHIESLFEHWMTWENYGIIKKDWNKNDQSTWCWNLDHIIPQTHLPYSSMKEENFKKTWALDNLRPLCSKQNILDGNKRTKEEIIHIKQSILDKLSNFNK